MTKVKLKKSQWYILNVQSLLEAIETKYKDKELTKLIKYYTITDHYDDEIPFMFTSGLGLQMAMGLIAKKDIPTLKEFREKTTYTEVFIGDKRADVYQRKRIK